MNYAFIPSFSVARFQQPTVSLCYAPKIAKPSSLKSHFVVWPENHQADFSMGEKKKVIRGQGPCLDLWSPLVPSAGLDQWKQGDRDTSCSRVIQVQKGSSQSISTVCFPSVAPNESPKMPATEQSHCLLSTEPKKRGHHHRHSTKSFFLQGDLGDSHGMFADSGSIFPTWNRKGRDVFAMRIRRDEAVPYTFKFY